MSKENKSLLVGALSVFLIAVLFVLGYHFVDRAPRSALDHALGQKVSVSNTVVLNKEEDLGELTNGEVYLLSTYDALTKTTSLKGVQTISKNNFGTIKLDVLIDVENRKVFVAATNIEQTPDGDIDYTKIISDHIKADYQNISVDDLDTLDLSAGQTAGKGSLGRATVKNSVTAALEKVGIEIAKPTIPPYYEWYGDYEVESLDFETTSDYIVAKEIILVDGLEAAYVFVAEKEGSYEMGGYESSGTIRVYVFVDLDGVIVYVGLPEAFYNHSGGNYKAYAQAVANTYVGSSIKSLTQNDIDHESSQTASHSSKVVKELIEDVSLAVQTLEFPGKPVPYQKLGWFGEGYQVENDSASELLDDKLIKVEIVKKDDLVIGYVYTVKGEGEYDVSGGQGYTSSEFITVVIATDADGLILGIDLPVNEYKHSHGEYLESSQIFVLSYKDQDIKDLLDMDAGQTTPNQGSRVLIKQLINYVSTKVKGAA